VSIGSLCIDLRLQGCRSLKDKRQRLAGLRDRFGRTPNLAVFESDYSDVLHRAQWTFVAGASSANVVEQLLAGVERDVHELVDAEVIDIRRAWLD
jgi:uncharacterized protein YlxP (DUF503 family)